MIDRIAKLWSEGKALSAIADAIGVSRGKVAGMIDRARKSGDSRFRSRPPKPPKPRVVKPADENVGNRRLQALVESRVLGVADPAMDRVLRRMRDAMIRDLHKCIAAIERLPAAKDRELALEQAAKRASQIEFLRALIAEVGNTMQ